MSESESQSTQQTHQTLTWLAWIVVSILCLNVSYFVGEEVGGIVYQSGRDWLAIFNGFWIGMIKAAPTILIAWAIGEFALLFGRCGEGDVFTEKNIATFKSGADSLIWAGIWSGIVGPTLLGWISLEFRGIATDFTDLALAVAMMGVILHGLALIFADAVKVKLENDGFV